MDIVIAGTSITPASRWNGIPIIHGQFDSLRHTDGRVMGAFYGPNHEESYGVFHNNIYFGSFGAKRD